MTTTADAVFGILVDTAVAGTRCPTNDQIAVMLRERDLRLYIGPEQISPTTWLAHAGRIRVDVYAHNWRVVTILEGEHAGKSTAAAPSGGKPYLTIDKNGSVGSRGAHAVSECKHDRNKAARESFARQIDKGAR